MLRRQCAFLPGAPNVISWGRPDGRSAAPRVLLPAVLGLPLQRAFAFPPRFAMSPYRALHRHWPLSTSPAPRPPPLLKRRKKRSCRHRGLIKMNEASLQQQQLSPAVEGLAAKWNTCEYPTNDKVEPSPPLSDEMACGDAKANGVDDYEYGIDDDNELILEETEEAKAARLFTSRVTLVFKRTGGPTYDDAFNVIWNSTEGLKRLLKDPNASEMLRRSLSHSIAKRTEALNAISRIRLRLKLTRPWHLSSCHFYRKLVRTRSTLTQVDPCTSSWLTATLALEYKTFLATSTAEQLAADMHDTVLGTISPSVFDVAGFRAKLVRNAAVTRRIGKHLHVSIARFLNPVYRETDAGELLGHAYAYRRWQSFGVVDPLRELNLLRTRYRAKQVSLHPLSTHYPESVVRTFFDIESRASSLFFERLDGLVREFRLLRLQLRKDAVAAGKNGALTPFVPYLKQSFVDLDIQSYKRNRRSFAVRELRRWGYKPSPWYRRVVLGQSISTRYFAQPRNSPKRLRNTRTQLRRIRQTALGKLRRLLSAALLSYQSRSIRDVRGVDLIPALPKSHKPSTSTLVGKSIALLGYYDNRDQQNNNIKTNYSRKPVPLTTSHGQPLIRWTQVASNAPPFKPSPRSRTPRPAAMPFKPSSRLRTPHPAAMPFNTEPWEESIHALADNNVDCQENELGSDRSASSLYNGRGRDAEHSRNDTPNKEDRQPPNDQLNDGDSQTPAENMQYTPERTHPSESEHEQDSESEMDEDSEMEEVEEQHTPLAYQIPPEVLRSALEAPPQTRASYWSQKLYRGPDDKELLVHYCTNMEMSERVAKHFLNEKVVGFDIEWKPWAPVNSIKMNASLLQLAVENRIALFHIARFPGNKPEQLLPPTLKAILESPDTLKVGVAVKGDCTRLEKYLNLSIRGVFELSRLYNLVEYYATDPSKVNNKLVKLSTQVQQHLLLPLHKGEPFADEPQYQGSVRGSDWSRPLDLEQIHYAAADAYAGFRLFDALESKRKKLKPTPPIPLVCDYDNKPAPRLAQTARRTKKTKPELEKVIAQSLSGLEAEDADEEADEEMYETAAEELAEEDEGEDPDVESSSESSDEPADDSDADYVPKTHGRISLAQRLTDEPTTSAAPAHRTGRVGFLKLSSIDPGYPTLPTLSSEVEPSSDESEASSPRPKTFLPKRAATDHEAAEASPAKAQELDDEFADNELEEALCAMDLDEEPAEAGDIACKEHSDVNMADVSIRAEPAQREEEAPVRHAASPPVIGPNQVPHTPQYELAAAWASTYLSSTIPSPSSTAPPRIRATMPPLRAYHLWHHQRLPVDVIGAHLRDPPLAQSTVSSYIIQAINMEKLEYREADLVALMMTLPTNLRLGRYGSLSKKLGICDK